MSFAGSGWPRSQPGQWRQPSPESVSRTAAPLPMITQRPAALATASWMKRAGATAKLRIRAKAVDASMAATLEQGFKQLGVAVCAWERRRARAEKEGAVGRVQEHGHHVGPAQLAEDPVGAVELAETLDAVGANRRAREQERHWIPGVDHVGVSGRRVIAGHADDRPLGRQRCELFVERLDRLLFDLRIFRMTGQISRFEVREHERIARGEPL